MTNEKIKEIRVKAHNYENFSGCSQAVLLALQEELNIGNTETYKAATAFAGGVTRRGETCGALIGALMALGIHEGREKKEDIAKLQSTVSDGYTLSLEFMQRLEKEYEMKTPLTSTLCRDLMKAIYGRTWNLADSTQRTDFIASGGHSDHGCLKVCGIAAEVTAEMIMKKRNG